MGDKLYDFNIDSLGESKIPSPIRMSSRDGDGVANYVYDTDRDRKSVV